MLSRSFFDGLEIARADTRLGQISAMRRSQRTLTATSGWSPPLEAWTRAGCIVAVKTASVKLVGLSKV